MNEDFESNVINPELYDQFLSWKEFFLAIFLIDNMSCSLCEEVVDIGVHMKIVR